MPSRWRQTCNSLNWREMQLSSSLSFSPSSLPSSLSLFLFLSLLLRPSLLLNLYRIDVFSSTYIYHPREDIFCNSPDSVRISVSMTRSIRHMRHDGRRQGETDDWLTRLNLIAHESFVLHNCTEELSPTVYIMLITCRSLLPLIEYKKVNAHSHTRAYTYTRAQFRITKSRDHRK